MTAFKENNRIFIPSKSIYYQIGGLYCLTNLEGVGPHPTGLVMPIVIMPNSDSMLFKFISPKYASDKFEYVKPDQIVFHEVIGERSNSHVLSNINVANIFSGKTKIHNNKKLTNIVCGRFSFSIEELAPLGARMKNCNVYPLGMRLADLSQWETKEIRLWYKYHLNMSHGLHNISKILGTSIYDNLSDNHHKKILINEMQRHVAMKRGGRRLPPWEVADNAIQDDDTQNSNHPLVNAILANSYEVVINDNHALESANLFSETRVFVVDQDGKPFKLYSPAMERFVNDIHDDQDAHGHEHEIEALIFKKEANYLIVGNVLLNSVTAYELVEVINTQRLFCRNLIDIQNRNRIHIYTKTYARRHGATVGEKYVLTDPYEKNVAGIRKQKPELGSMSVRQLKALNKERHARRSINKSLLEL